MFGIGIVDQYFNYTISIITDYFADYVSNQDIL